MEQLVHQGADDHQEQADPYCDETDVRIHIHIGHQAGGGIDHLAFSVGPRDELDAWATRLDQLGITHAGITEEELKAIDKEIRSIVNEAADFAETSPEPDPSELYTDVLVERY